MFDFQQIQGVEQKNLGCYGYISELVSIEKLAITAGKFFSTLHFVAQRRKDRDRVIFIRNHED